MSIVTTLNKSEHILLESVIDKSIEIQEFIEIDYLKAIEKELNELYVILHGNNVEDYQLDYVKYRMLYNIDIIRNLNTVTDSCYKDLNGFIDIEFVKYEKSLKDSYNNNQELMSLKRRIKLTVKRINNIKNDINSDMTRDLHSLVKEIILLLVAKDQNSNELVKLIKPEVNINIKGFEPKNIFSYKDMVKLAKDNGYEYKRTSGDHIIMEHGESHRIVPIPAHQLNRGLSIEIQKQIVKRKVM